MGRKRALSPEQFRMVYIPLRAEYKNNDESIAHKMGISKRTLARYLEDPDYVTQLSSNDNNGTIKSSERAMSIINQAYDQFEADIKEARKEKDFGKVRSLLIEALKICRVDADVNRVFNMFVNVDKRDQSVGKTEVHAEIKGEVAREIFEGKLLCPECGADCSGPLLAKHTEGVEL